MITIYDVSSRHDRLVRMCGTPYTLPPIVRPDGPHLGYAFYQPLTLAGDKSLSIYQMSSRGSISLMNLDHRPADTVQEIVHSTSSLDRAAYPQDGQGLANVMQEDLGSHAARTFKEVDLGLAYQRQYASDPPAFMLNVWTGLFIERKAPSLSAQTNAVFETLESMPRFWQDSDVPVEHSVTT